MSAPPKRLRAGALHCNLWLNHAVRHGSTGELRDSATVVTATSLKQSLSFFSLIEAHTPCKWVSRLFCCTHTAYCIRFEVYVVHPQAALETLIHLTYPPPPPSPLPRILLKAPLRLM
ncbi:hypothetical protein PF004_g5549 [Phytophthora fragariae]|uniref:Uncharacterized protein n=1 Tax=Phytophthora fragariae TaxID=53985 RepID=A0A6G0PF68_9STRA|nr:hypothetical protein PF004_g5549 [Phytophthora fragariae]